MNKPDTRSALAALLDAALTGTRPASTSTPSERVWIARCHCKNDHMIAKELFLLPFDDSWLGGDGDIDLRRIPANVLATIAEHVENLSLVVVEKIASGELESTCKVCGGLAPTWHFCPGSTKFANLAEAEREIREGEAKSRVVARLAAAIGMRLDR